MTTPLDPISNSESSLDEAVRKHLDAEAGRTDARALWESVASRLEAEEPPTTSRRQAADNPRTRPFWAAASVACLAAAVFLMALFFPSGQFVSASPAEVVRAARDAEAAVATRCYRIEIKLPPQIREGLIGLALDRGERTLCTRGDRFVVEPGFAGKGAWGRDATGRVWIAPTPVAAAAFEESELSSPLRTALKIHELELRPLLDEVLADFEVTWNPTQANSSEVESIVARRRGAGLPFQITAVELVVEKRTRIIQSLMVHRAVLGGPEATISFKLLRTMVKKDADFTPEFHLQEKAPIYDGAMAPQRRRLLIQQLGNGLLSGRD